MWIIITFIAIAIIFYITKSRKEVNYLNEHPFEIRFETFIKGINDKLMNGNGQLIKVDNKEYFLNSNRLKIQFIYRMNTLKVIRKEDKLALTQNSSYTFSNTIGAREVDQLKMIEYYIKHHYENF
ncbi:MAG TPA: hypothetical protein VFD78_07175 [Chitinophagaceae bacterium]|nr:hypothetical protein [Chitinophagaceae bacterium]